MVAIEQYKIKSTTRAEKNSCRTEINPKAASEENENAGKPND